MKFTRMENCTQAMDRGYKYVLCAECGVRDGVINNVFMQNGTVQVLEGVSFNFDTEGIFGHREV